MKFVGAVPASGTRAPFRVLAPARMQLALMADHVPSTLQPSTKVVIAVLTPVSRLAPSAVSTAAMYASASASVGTVPF